MTTYGTAARTPSFAGTLLAAWLLLQWLLAACGSAAGSGASAMDSATSAETADADAHPTDTAADDGAAADGDAADSSAAAGDAAADASPANGLSLTSPAFADQGTMAAEFTCDGVGHSPPLAWAGVPAGTVELALLMTTEAKDGTKWNWVLYGIPPTLGSLASGQKDAGTFGLTSDGPELAYAPPCSQGPGAKVYTFTLYALSAKPSVPSAAKLVTGPVLTAALQGITLASSSLSVSYTRPN